MNRTRGASMVEFALSVSALLFVLFGIIDFGRAWYTDHALANLARQGSRWASVRGGACSFTGCPAQSADVQTYVRGLNTPLLTSSSLTVTATWPGNGGCSVTTGQKNARGCVVNVSVSYPFNYLLLPITARTLTSTSQMIISH